MPYVLCVSQCSIFMLPSRTRALYKTLSETGVSDVDDLGVYLPGYDAL